MDARATNREVMIDHVHALCEEHGIRILDRRRYGGVAWKRDRIIAIKPVKTQRTYIVALHEIAHIIGPGRSGSRLEQEAAAWAFVMSEAKVHLYPSTYRRMQAYLESYLVRARRSKRMSIPHKDHQFWHVRAQIGLRATS